MQRTADFVFWLAIALWLALALVGGIAAMAVFPAARGLPLSMVGYEAFLAAEPEQGRMMVAGFLVEQVFVAANWPRLALAAITALALCLQLLSSRHPYAPRLRLASLALAAGALLTSVFWAMPRFREEDRGYREAALAGQVEEALALKPSVDTAHATASRVASLEAFAILALIGLTALSGGRRG